MLRVWLIVMFAGAGGIVVGSFATSRLLDSDREAPAAIASSRTLARPVIDATQARHWLQATVARGGWVGHADPAFQSEYVLRPGHGYATMKPGVAMASNHARHPVAGGRQL